MPPLTTAEPAVALLAATGPAGGAGDRRGIGASLRRPLVLALGLALLAVVAYRGSLGNGFVNLDDPEYVTENPIVRAGLTAAGLRWAATAIVVANWHPATLVSHMLDCQLYGLNPRGHHLTSLLLHVTATLLLFEFLRRTTGRPLPSAAVAALFAVHPTHVESVAWVAERKDVLCGVFWMATLAAYLHYGRRPGLGRYLLVAAAFALALAAKPMAVTLPLVLLLLDAWPLGRLRLGPAERDGDLAAGERRSFLVPLVLEKLPLLALSAAACVVTLRAQRGPLALDAATPWSLRLANALDLLRRLSREDFLSRAPRRHLSLPARRPGLAGRPRRPAARRHHGASRWPGRGGRPICWSAGSGSSARSSRSAAWCRSGPSGWPTATPTCRRSGSISRSSGGWLSSPAGGRGSAPRSPRRLSSR